LLRFFESCRHGLRGIFYTLKTERNFKIHVGGMCFAIAVGIYLGLSLVEWGFITFAIGFVLAAELFNTAIERIGDEVAQGKQNDVVRNIKDISAGAVIISVMVSIAIGIIFLLVPLIVRLIGLN
jgi:diacylglycerol kinase